MVKLTINGTVKEYEEGITFEGIAKDYAEQFASDIAGVVFNGSLKELLHKPSTDGELSFYDTGLRYCRYLRLESFFRYQDFQV